MNNDYSSPEFMGNSYIPNTGTLTGNELHGGVPQANAKRTMVGGTENVQQNGMKRTTTLAGFLVSFSKTDTGEFWELREGNNSLGTNKGNEICLQEKHVSGDHATINISRDMKNQCWKFQIVDKTSSNGTFVNDERLDIYQGFTLTDKSRIKVGEYEFMLFITDRFVNKLDKNSSFVENKGVADYSQMDWNNSTQNTLPGY